MFSGKPRPAVVIQADALLTYRPTILVCIVTSDPQLASGVFHRIPVAPTEANRLNADCTIIADQIVTVRRESIGSIIGHLDEPTIGRLNIALAVIQDLA